MKNQQQSVKRIHPHMSALKDLQRIFLALGLSCAFLLTGVVSSCMRPDNDLRGSSQRVTFSLDELRSANETQEITGSSDLITDYDVIEMQGGDTPFYLHMEEVDQFPSAQELAAEAMPEVAMGLRAAPVTTSKMHSSIGVFAYSWDSSSSWNPRTVPNFMYNVEISSTDNKWDTPYYWPGAQRKVRFLAYAPYGAEGLAAFPAAASAPATLPVLDYTVPQQVSQQRDLVSAMTTDFAGNYNANVPLRFMHLCTAVRFVTSDKLLAGRITSVSLKGVYSHGTNKLGVLTWENHSNPADFTQTLNFTVDGTANKEVVGGTTTFMMLPQRLPEGASVQVTYEVNGKTLTLTSSIAGKEWERGKTVTYRISPSSIITETKWVVKVDNSDKRVMTFEPWIDKTLPFSVVSESVIKSKDQIITTQLPWTVEYSLDSVNWSSTAPAWFENLANSHEGTKNIPNVRLRAKQGKNLDQAIIDQPTKTGIFDLSTEFGSMNTANSYIVHCAGRYKFPLVYGNAIKNGQDNREAYNRQPLPGEVSLLSPFKNCSDMDIKAPYIYDPVNGETAFSHAKLEWQDVDGLVTDIKLSADRHYIEFTVPKDQGRSLPRQGNAKISLWGDHGNLIWTWHIWVTPLSQQEHVFTLAKDGEQSYEIMQTPLGWVQKSDDSFYDRRDIWLRLKQTSTGNQTIIHLIQPKRLRIRTDGRGNYYQWGRKDPFTAQRPLYGLNTNAYQVDGSWSEHTYGESLQFPNQFFLANFSWDKQKRFNLWNNGIPYAYVYNDPNGAGTYIRNNKTVGIKTIYDPCPPFMMIPPAGMFMTYADEFTSQAISLGYMEKSNGNLEGGGFGGAVWCSDPYWHPRGLGYGNYLPLAFVFDNNGKKELEFKAASYGFPVWAVRTASY